MSFSLDIEGLFEIGRFVFGANEMRGFAETQLEAQKQRIAEGVNTSDLPARKLNPNYAKAKENRGLAPMRNMRFSGETLSSLQVTNAEENEATIAFTDPAAERKAYFANSIDPMVGTSPKDAEKVKEAVNDKVPTMIQRSIRPID